MTLPSLKEMRGQFCEEEVKLGVRNEVDFFSLVFSSVLYFDCWFLWAEEFRGLC